jgi:hypothetical protein
MGTSWEHQNLKNSNPFRNRTILKNKPRLTLGPKQIVLIRVGPKGPKTIDQKYLTRSQTSWVLIFENILYTWN